MTSLPLTLPSGTRVTAVTDTCGEAIYLVSLWLEGENRRITRASLSAVDDAALGEALEEEVRRGRSTMLPPAPERTSDVEVAVDERETLVADGEGASADG